MRKAIIIILGLVLYPFGCHGQVNGTLPNNDGCDTVFIEDPSMDTLIKRLTADNQVLTDNNQSLTVENTTLTAVVVNKNAEIESLKASNTSLADLLAECENKPPTTVTDTIEVEVDYITINGKEYKVADIEIILPKLEVDTIFVSHSNDDKTNRKFFHHGSFEAPYPKDITFETKELCMITVEFPDSLGTYRTLDKFRVKRIQDHENARTLYEFIN